MRGLRSNLDHAVPGGEPDHDGLVTEPLHFAGARRALSRDAIDWYQLIAVQKRTISTNEDLSHPAS